MAQTSNPDAISPRLIQVVNTEQSDLFRLARYTWSLPYSRGYGRRSALSHRGRRPRQRRHGDPGIAVPAH